MSVVILELAILATTVKFDRIDTTRARHPIWLRRNIGKATILWPN